MNRIFALWILVAVIGCRVDAGVHEGLAAMGAGDFAAARKEFLPLAEKGDDKAMLTMGQFYHYGEGVAVDGPKALEWYLRAATKGNLFGYNNAGVLYRDAVAGLPRDLELAYALLTLAIENATSDELYDKAVQNLDKVDVYISKEEIDRAKKLGRKDLTLEKLKKRNESGHSSPGVAIDAAFPVELLAGLSAVYKLDPSRNEAENRGVKIEEVREDNYRYMPGTLGYSSGRKEDLSTVLSQGVYTCSAGGFAIRVPRLSSGSITLAESSYQGGIENQVRFFEKGTHAISAWPLEKKPWHAVVVTTRLPPEWEGQDAKVLARIRSMQNDCVTNLPGRVYASSSIDGPLGKGFQTVVFNRIPNESYPQVSARLAPLRHGVVTLGINRVLYRNRMIVEFGLIVARPEGQDVKKFVEYAMGRMDLFMSGFSVLSSTRHDQKR